MATRELQNVLNSGELTSLYLGGITSDKKVLVSSEVQAEIADVAFTNLKDTPNSMIGKSQAKVAVNSTATGLEFVDAAYGGWTNSPNLLLTNVYQKITGFTSMLPLKNITEVSGTFTAVVGGIYTWAIERIYHNYDTAPVPPIVISMDFRKNGVSQFVKSGTISAATGPSEPSVVSFTSPFLQEVVAGDYFEVYIKATEGAQSPSNTVLIQLQLIADKIH